MLYPVDMKYTNILVATDFSITSDHALKMAEELRQKSGGQIYLIHASDISTKLDWLTNDTSQPYLLAHFNQDLKESLNSKIQDQMDRCQVSCESEIIIGKAYESIHDRIKKYSIDLLVMGHVGVSGLMHLGGLTQKMVESSTVPLMVVKEFKNTKKVAGLIDPNDVSEKVINTVSELSDLYSTRPEFISVWPDLYSPYRLNQFIDPYVTFTDEERDKIKNLVHERVLEKLGSNASKATITVDITQKDIADALNDKIKVNQIDLAILVRHHKGVLERYFLGSTTRKVMNQMSSSLLIIPES